MAALSHWMTWRKALHAAERGKLLPEAAQWKRYVIAGIAPFLLLFNSASFLSILNAKLESPKSTQFDPTTARPLQPEGGTQAKHSAQGLTDEEIWGVANSGASAPITKP